MVFAYHTQEPSVSHLPIILCQAQDKLPAPRPQLRVCSDPNHLTEGGDPGAAHTSKDQPQDARQPTSAQIPCFLPWPHLLLVVREGIWRPQLAARTPAFLPDPHSPLPTQTFLVFTGQKRKDGEHGAILTLQMCLLAAAKDLLPVLA